MPQIIVLSAISRMVLEIKRKTKKFLFLKKTLNDNPHYLFYDQFCELLHVSDICPFGEYEHGYMVLLVDSKNNIYGVMDDYVEGFGNDYFKMLNQLYNR